MPWITEHKREWRTVILLIMLVAIIGPWFFERVNVPAEYECSYRLYGDFCGVPMSGMLILSTIIPGFISVSTRLISGKMTFIGWSYNLLISSGIFLLVLPLFSTLLLILRRDHRHRQIFNIVAWGLAAGVGLLFGITNYPKLFFALWGNWLYVGVAIGALVLEGLTLKAQKNGD